MSKDILIEAKNLKQFFPIQKGIFKKTVGYIKAVNNINLKIFENETVGLVGESGCGKTTLGRTLMRLYEPTGGEINFKNNGKLIKLTGLDDKQMRKMRVNMQMIFQDPFSSLNERMTVMENIGEPLYVNGILSGQKLKERVEDLLVKVGLKKEHLTRYPHSFSGGQRQRIGIARALAVNPSFIVADESVSALDVSVQAQILNLLKDLQSEFNLTYLFISHDLSVIRYMCDRIAVMYVGSIVEIAERDKLLGNPFHPYTEALLSAVPRANTLRKKDRIMMPEELPDPGNLPEGCDFNNRCQYSQEICKNKNPELTEVLDGHYAACHFAGEIGLKGINSGKVS